MRSWGIAALIWVFSLSGLAGTQPGVERRANGLLRFVAQNHIMRSVGLYTLMANRCNRYLPFPETVLCQTTITRQLQILDYDIIMTAGPKSPQEALNPQAFVFVAFKKNLLELLSQPQTALYLKSMQDQLTKHLLGEAEVNIWELTLRHYRSRLTAAKVIATLFQDTSMAKLHLAYLDRNRIGGNASFSANKELLSRVISTINLVLDYNEDSYQDLFYPKEVRKHLNRNIYHFYVPLYLAMQLTHEGFNSTFAQIAPLMMTLTYEFVTTGKDNRYLFNDPPRLDPQIYQHKLRDIYGGYSGARFGTGQKIHPDFFLRMQDSFARSTTQAVKLLLR